MEKNQLKILAIEIKDSLYNIYAKHWEYTMFIENNVCTSEDSTYDFENEYFIAEIENKILITFKKIEVFLEMKGLPKYLKEFKKSINPYFKENKLFDNEINPLNQDGEPTLIIVRKLWQWILPIPEFSTTSFDEKINLLECILNDTQHIIKKTNTKIRHETDIYNQVEWILRLVFNSVNRKNRSRFNSIYKNYEPDILIPELNTSIEYKYVKEYKNIETYVDEIVIDEKNYRNDPLFNTFYAVFYIEDHSIITKSGFEALWSQKKFGSNWKPIIVFA